MRQFIRYLLIVGYLLLPVSLAWSEEPRSAVIQQKETTVYITRTGEKYHRDNCRYVKKQNHHHQIPGRQRWVRGV